MAGHSEGERWAQDLLRKLREDRWHPRACARFMMASLTRARQTAAARPKLAREAHRYSIAGFLAATSGSVLMRKAGLATASPRANAAWALASGAMLWWHIGMVEGLHGEPRHALSAADAVTYARVLAAPAMLAAADDRRLFVSLLAAGGGTDALDGVLARRVGCSRLGRDLDAAADVTFFTAAALAAHRADFLAGPVVAALMARELSLVGVSALHYFAHAAPPPPEAVGATRFAGPALTLGLTLAGSGKRTLGGVVVTAAAGAATVAHARVLAGAG